MVFCLGEQLHLQKPEESVEDEGRPDQGFKDADYAIAKRSRGLDIVNRRANQPQPINATRSPMFFVHNFGCLIWFN